MDVLSYMYSVFDVTLEQAEFDGWSALSPIVFLYHDSNYQYVPIEDIRDLGEGLSIMVGLGLWKFDMGSSVL